MTLLNELEHKNVLILGLSREGMSTYTFLRQRYPDKKLGLADRKTEKGLEPAVWQRIRDDRNVELFLGDNYLASVPRYEIIFKSPGISPFIPEIVAAVQRGQRISSNTELFFEVCPGTVIGVTGTKGKSTTTALIYQVLHKGGVDARLAGNIGIAPLLSLNDGTATTVFVMELSSHQLYGIRRSPAIAVLQSIVPEHLDYYGSFEIYAQAKRTITENQTENDLLLFNAASPITSEIARTSKARTIPFGFSRTGDTCCYIDKDSIVLCTDGRCEAIVPIDAVPLKGEFNLQNVMPAVVIGTRFGIPNQTITAAIQEFKALEHRLELSGSCRGVEFYNDSLSTIPEAAIAALQSFGDRQVILLAGGFDRGQDYAEFARTILTRPVKTVILFPTTGQRLWEELERQAAKTTQLPTHLFLSDMSMAVQAAYAHANEGDVVLLSPAAASFGGFDDYRDRGEQFKSEVAKLIKQFG